MHSNNQGNRGGTVCLSKAGLAEGTNAATIKTAAPNGAGIDYMIKGYLYHKADGDNIAMNALALQADDTSCLYLIQIDASGDFTLKKGTEVLTAELSADAVGLVIPEPDDDNCPVGLIKVVNDGGTFTSGTTDLGAGTVTDTYYDIGLLPTRPLT